MPRQPKHHTPPFRAAELLREAGPFGQGAFVHFRYAYRPSLTSSLATGGYLATLGSGKVGFTVTGRGRQGKPEYVGGVRGIVDAQRHALLPRDPGLSGNRRRAGGTAFRALVRSHRALPHATDELERSEYLQYKLKERRQQDEHQQMLDAAAAR